MLETEIAAQSYIENPDPKLRSTALEVILFYWKAPRSVVSRCEELASSDPDDDVREAAFACISDVYRNSNDKKIGTLFARLVLDEEIPKKLRKSAYFNLVIIAGLSREKRINILKPDFVFPEAVDWQFVQSFMKK